MKKRSALILSAMAGMAMGAGVVKKVNTDKLNGIQKMSDKHFALFLMMDQWVKVKQEGKCLSEWFERNGYNKIAIYGMSYAGKTLIDELADSKLEISCGIDRNKEVKYADVAIVSVDGKLEEVDVVIVTAITFFDEIDEMLSKKLSCPIISLEDVLYEV